MKRKILILAMLLLFSGTFVFQSCDEESTPAKEYGAFTLPEVVAPEDGTFISPAGVTVELSWSSTDADGDPDNWDVYFGASEEPALVATGHTSQSYTVTVVTGTKYYWQVIGWDANNVPSRGEIWSFEIVDPDAPLAVNMEWSTNVIDAIGLDVDPEDAVDLRLKILDESKAVVEVVNTSGFEEYSFLDTQPDGKYTLVTDLASTLDAGDFNESINVSLSLVFNQRGTLYQRFDYVDAMTNDFTCDSYYTILAEITKAGSTYTIENVAEAQWAADINSLVGTWNGTDQYGFEDDVTITVSNDVMYIYGLGVDMMEGWWGEPVVASNPVPVVFDWTTLGAIQIEDQYYLTSVYGGDNYDYNIFGTGKVGLCGAIPEITIEYEIAYSADGWGIGAYLDGAYGMGIFKVTLTPATGGKGFSAIDSKVSSEKIPLPQKPVR